MSTQLPFPEAKEHTALGEDPTRHSRLRGVSSKDFIGRTGSQPPPEQRGL